MNVDEQQLRRDMVAVCHRMDSRGLVAGTDGNVSVRVSRNRLIATPTGMSKGLVQADDLVVCDLRGQQIEGKRRLTTEIRIHLAAYQERDDVCAVVHAHPPYATAFAVARRQLDERLMPEAYIAVGKVALAPYGTPSTGELEAGIRPACREHDAILLANHGAMALGRDVWSAAFRMEALEQLARISTITRVLGSAASLTPDEIARLEAIRGVYGAAQSDEPCYACGLPRPRPATPNGERAVPAHDAATGAFEPARMPVPDRAQIRELVRRALREERGG
jgi:L-fuculose-phosphate aldolase